ncbi:hypothetical protein E2542_SST22758 [Spatholobus suberectus]|nr:hypothetical protein E2542_SST22758 [Spatholobus suberectus]
MDDKMRQIFNKFNKNGNKKISISELKTCSSLSDPKRPSFSVIDFLFGMATVERSNKVVNEPHLQREEREQGFAEI